MKQIMWLAFSFLLMTGASVFAQEVVKVAKDSTTTTVTTTTKVVPIKEEMKSADLPQPIKDLNVSFKTQGWDTNEKAYVVKGSAGNIVYYGVTYKNTTSGEIKTIHLDAQGKLIND